MINQQQIDIIKKFLIKNLDVDVDAIYLFGSSVKNTMRKDSDIDVAFLSNKSVDSFDLFLLSQKLADLLGREVDLIDIKKVSTVFQAQIISTGLVIYSRPCQTFSLTPLWWGELSIFRKFYDLFYFRIPFSSSMVIFKRFFFILPFTPVTKAIWRCYLRLVTLPSQQGMETAPETKELGWTVTWLNNFNPRTKSGRFQYDSCADLIVIWASIFEKVIIIIISLIFFAEFKTTMG